MSVVAIQIYPPKMQEFIAHWTQVNAVLGANPLTLKGNYSLAAFTTDRTAIVTAIDSIIPVINLVQGNMVTRDTLKVALKTRLAQFRAAVIAFFPDSRYSRMLPTSPPLTNMESQFLTPFIDISNIWSLINIEVNVGFTPPLLLPSGYTKVLFDTDVAALRAAYIGLENALVGASAARATRDVLLPNANQRMKQYRQAVIARLPSGSPLLNNIPAYTIATGPAAQEVNPSIIWDDVKKKAVITWAASGSKDVLEYSVRTSPGASYEGKNETVVKTVDASKFSVETDEGLLIPGATVLFKVYVITKTGREKGSRVLKVTRP